MTSWVVECSFFDVCTRAFVGGGRVRNHHLLVLSRCWTRACVCACLSWGIICLSLPAAPHPCAVGSNSKKQKEDVWMVCTMVSNPHLCLTSHIHKDIVIYFSPSSNLTTHTHSHTQRETAVMHLMYYTNEEGRRVYTLKKEAPNGEITYSAHPGKSRVCVRVRVCV